MQITIRIDKNYGIETAYPVCRQATLFARIAGTKTLTRATLQSVTDLGYTIVIAQEAFKTFNHLQIA